jgi:hypothetical protein
MIYTINTIQSKINSEPLLWNLCESQFSDLRRGSLRGDSVVANRVNRVNRVY